MNFLGWFRSLRLRWKLILGLPLSFLLLVALYVLVRTVQYAAAEQDPGAYVPPSCHASVRLKDLDTHLPRIAESVAWRVLERKVLRDRAVRKHLNGLLKDAGAPTLDELQDGRKVYAQAAPWAWEALGKDAVAGLRLDSRKPRLAGAVRLRWWQYLATPFAAWALPAERVGGATALRIRQGKQEVYVAFAGALAVASTDKELLGEALQRRGAGSASPTAPLELKLRFEGAPELLKLRRLVQDTGAFPYVRLDTAEALTATLDLDGPLIVAEARLEKAEALLGTSPPLALRGWAPESASGLILANTGAKDLVDWVRAGTADPDPGDALRKNVKQVLDLLDDAGLSSAFLPKTEPGMALVTGSAESEGRVYPCFALILPSGDPKGATEALTAMIRKRAGAWKDKAYFETRPVEDTTMYSWNWPKALEINDFLRACYAPVKGAFVLANNPGFCEQVIRTASQGGGLEGTPSYRRLATRMKETGLGTDPGLAGGFAWPPMLRESLDGLLVHVARQAVYASLDPSKVRASVLEELKVQLGREPVEAEVVPAFNAAVERLKAEREESSKEDLRALEFVKWAGFEATVAGKGVRFRAVLELR